MDLMTLRRTAENRGRIIEHRQKSQPAEANKRMQAWGTSGTGADKR